MGKHMKKNITLSAEESLIAKARSKAEREHATLNQKFREWLSAFVSEDDTKETYASLMRRISYAKASKKFTREEMNER
jgi:hypothetical protein